MSKIITNEFRTKYNIDEDVCKSLDLMGYVKPMPVQDRVMEQVLGGHDLIVQSQTGSGKTAAFGIPIIHNLEVDENLPQVLVITPTRELAVQVCEELADIGRYKKIRCLPIYGKQPIHIQLRQLKQRVHVAVGTPGRIGDLIRKKHLNLEAIKYLVIDEADELLKRGFIDEVEAIISRVPSERTTLLFSATMPEEITSICEKYMERATRIEVESDQEPIDQIKQSWYEVSEDWKFLLLTRILDQQKPDSCIIFCKTRVKVDQLSDRLSRARFKCVSLHGDMAQKYRLRSISEFKDAKVPILVATDLAARGIHVDKLDLVVNYNVPQEDDSYVHRIGRTGRVGEKGEAITFVSEHDRKRWAEIIEFIGYKVPKGPDSLLADQSDSTKKPPRATHSQKEQSSESGKRVDKPKTTDKDSRGSAKSKEQNSSRGNDRNSKAKQPRNDKQHRDIMRIRINAGKKKKVRAGDILGALSNLPGITSEDIGIIDIQDGCSYIEVFNNKGQQVYDALPNTKVKGKDVTVKKVATK